MIELPVVSKPLITTRTLSTFNTKFKMQYSQTDSNNYAILIPPTPDTGATMNNPIISLMFDILVTLNWNVLRFNYSDAIMPKLDPHTKALVEMNYITDWYMDHIMKDENKFIVGGYGSGAMIALESLMRRPEINGFIALALAGQSNNNTFLAPCPHPGLFVHGKYDKIASLEKVQEIVKKLQSQQAQIELQIIDDDHFFTTHRHNLLKSIIKEYLLNITFDPTEPCEMED